MSSSTIVLFGGASGERRVSVASAQHIVAVLPESEAWFVAPDERVYHCSHAALLAHQRPFEADFVPDGLSAYPSLGEGAAAVAAREPVFVLGFHGGAGEDGTVQQLFESAGLAFTGSGSAASARAFDKQVAKAVARTAGIATAEARVLPADEEGARAAVVALLAVHGRVVVKPVADGSSVGLYHVRTAADVDAAVAAVSAPSAVTYLVEAFVRGTELTVGVVDDGSGPRALPASEVRLAPGRAFDFEGKYLGKGTVELTPAEVPEAVSAAARALAVTIHTALGCEGYSRTDVIATAAGPVFLETNTLPGLTRASFLPQQLAAEGTSVRAFLEAQIALARRRRSRR